MYNLYLDKPTEFVCEVTVKNASLKNAMARVVIASKDTTLMFEGVLKDKKCIVPIKRLKGLLDESSEGKIYFELIVEDMYFRPWKDEFVIEQHTDVKVKIQEQAISSKPIVEVSSVNNLNKSLSTPASDLVFICNRMGISKGNIGKKRQDFKQIVKEYFKSNPTFMPKSKLYICEAINELH